MSKYGVKFQTNMDDDVKQFEELIHKHPILIKQIQKTIKKLSIK